MPVSLFRILSVITTAAMSSLLSAEEWKPPEPNPDDFDWVQLESGEWLKGEIRGMQDDVLVFESDELDVLELDMDDINIVRSPKKIATRVGKKEIMEGTLLITKDKVIVSNGEEHSYPRSQLLAFVPDVTREIDSWRFKASAGMTLRSGNTDQTDYNARIEVIRRTTSSRFTLDYLGEYSKTDGFETVDSQRINSQFDIFFTDRMFARAPFFEYLSDPFQNLQYRMSIGAALGYDIIAGKDVSWTTTLGPGYQITEYDTVETGTDPKEEAYAMVFTSEYSWDLTSDITLHLDYRGQFTKREAGGTTQHGEARLEISLTDRLDLDLSAIWDRTGDPVADENGIVPDKNDYRFISTIGFDF